MNNKLEEGAADVGADVAAAEDKTTEGSVQTEGHLALVSYVE